MSFQSLHFKIPAKDIILTESEIKNIFSKSKIEMDQEISILSDKMNDFCDFEGGFTIVDHNNLQLKDYKLFIDNDELNIGRKIFRAIEGTKTIAVFVATIGPFLEKFKEYMQESSINDIFLEYIANTIGSEMAEKAAGYIQNKIKNYAKTQNLKITNRYSPGYCGWDISYQKNLFSLLPQNFCNIKLSPVFLMSPIKSVSGIIGLGENIKFQEYKCNMCNSLNCPSRVQC